MTTGDSALTAVLSRLKAVLGVDSDGKLAEALGITASTVANWRRRGHIPYATCARIAAERGGSLDWLVFGKEPPSLDPGLVGFTVVLFGGAVLAKDDGGEPTFDEIGERFAGYYNLIGQVLDDRASISARRHAFDLLAEEIMVVVDAHLARRTASSAGPALSTVRDSAEGSDDVDPDEQIAAMADILRRGLRGRRLSDLMADRSDGPPKKPAPARRKSGP